MLNPLQIQGFVTPSAKMEAFVVMLGAGPPCPPAHDKCGHLGIEPRPSPTNVRPATPLLARGVPTTTPWPLVFEGVANGQRGSRLT